LDLLRAADSVTWEKVVCIRELINQMCLMNTMSERIKVEVVYEHVQQEKNGLNTFENIFENTDSSFLVS